jgi:hypothetical protein
MPRPSIFLSGIVFALSLNCWAQPRIANSQETSVSIFPRQTNFPAAGQYRLPYRWAGMIEALNSPSQEKPAAQKDKDTEKTPETPGEKVWAVLNSSFGLWVLSSVVLAWITKAYSVREARKAENVKRRETVSRLDTEIAFRLAMALDGLRINKARLESSPTTPRGIHQNAYDYLENAFITFPEKGRDFSVFPEYRDRTFRALILELRTVVDAHEEPDLRKALNAYEELAEGGDIGSEDSSPQACNDAFVKVRELLENELVRSRWKARVSFLSIREKGNR